MTLKEAVANRVTRLTREGWYHLRFVLIQINRGEFLSPHALLHDPHENYLKNMRLDALVHIPSDLLVEDGWFGYPLSQDEYAKGMEDYLQALPPYWVYPCGESGEPYLSREKQSTNQ